MFNLVTYLLTRYTVSTFPVHLDHRNRIFSHLNQVFTDTCPASSVSIQSIQVSKTKPKVQVTNPGTLWAFRFIDCFFSLLLRVKTTVRVLQLKYRRLKPQCSRTWRSSLWKWNQTCWHTSQMFIHLFPDTSRSPPCPHNDCSRFNLLPLCLSWHRFNTVIYIYDPCVMSLFTIINIQ